MIAGINMPQKLHADNYMVYLLQNLLLDNNVIKKNFG